MGETTFITFSNGDKSNNIPGSIELAWELAHNYKVICVETLVGDRFIYMNAFIKLLEKECAKAKSKLIRIGKYTKTTSVCSHCLKEIPKLKLSVREWVCPYCRTPHDRDVNAARNILREGLAIYYSVVTKTRSKISKGVSNGL